MKKIKKYLIILALILIVITVGYLALRHVPEQTYAVQEIDSQAHWGMISGSLSYPSEEIPPLGVCAETVKGKDIYCTYKMIADEKYTYGFGYELRLPPDQYYVFSHTITEGNEKIGYTEEYKAYYSKFVTCGLEQDCPSHKPIAINIERNQVLSAIDPVDWYTN